MSGTSGTPMDRQLFFNLVSAYGADPKRWPLEHREQATGFAQTEEDWRMILEATGLDAALSSYRLPDPSARLHARILAQASSRTTRRKRLVRYGLGAGMIGISLAGALTGALAVVNLSPPPALTLGDTLTAFGNLQSESEIAEDGK